LLFMHVRCINRATREFFDRNFWLDTFTLPDTERKWIEERTENTISPAEFLKIRPSLNAGWSPEGFRARNYESISTFSITDYFEDEAGNPLDEIGLAQILSSQEYPVLLFNVGSVLRLGPTGIQRKEQ